MRTVYRYENDKGEGPYRTNYGLVCPGDIQAMCDAHADCDHPTWGYVYEYGEYDPDTGEYSFDLEEISGWDVGSGHVAACASRKALDAWFDGWHDVLAANGFHVAEYTVPEENVVDGHSGLQCAFLPVGW